MKRIALVFILFAVLFLLSVSSMAEEIRRIHVNGEADVKVEPNEVILSFGVETIDKDMDIAKKKNDEIVKKSIQVCLNHNIEKKYIQTENITIEPSYENYYKKENFLGYTVRNSIVVTLKDISKFEAVLTDILKSGVTNIHGINFRNTEFKKYREEARRLAILAAKEKAEKLCTELEMKLGKPIKIDEGANYNPRYRYSSEFWGGGYDRGMSQNVIQNVGGDVREYDLETLAVGKISIKANVSVEFEMK